jgi:hypothetical protein
MEPITKYNSYCITPGRWNPYNSDDLREMLIADTQIEADSAARQSAAMKEVRVRKKKRCYKPLTPEQRERKRAKDREYHSTHRFERNEYAKEWQRKHKADADAPERGEGSGA